MALNRFLRVQASTTGRPVAELRRQFLCQRFLARVFNGSGAWILTGGTGLLVRLAGARHSEDVDLIHRYGITAALGELRSIAGPSDLDPFTFELGRPSGMQGLTGGVTVRVQVYLGATKMGTFPIDIAVGRTLVGDVELREASSVIDIDDVAPLPLFAVISIEDQLSDKAAAMLCTYGASRAPSTRFHDLVDLVLIVCGCSISAATAGTAIRAQFARRGITAQRVTVPGPQWAVGYRQVVRATNVPAEARELDGAIALVAACLDPLLTSTRDSGVWDPVRRMWS